LLSDIRERDNTFIDLFVVVFLFICDLKNQRQQHPIKNG